MRRQLRALAKFVKDIKRASTKHYSSEEKIRIVLDGLPGETAVPNCAVEKFDQGIDAQWTGLVAPHSPATMSLPEI
jgi:hypothetical protein